MAAVRSRVSKARMACADEVAGLEDRLLVLAPATRDASHFSRVLEGERIGLRICTDIEELCRLLPRGAGALLLTERALSERALSRLREALGLEPPWSDLPLVIGTSRGAVPRPSDTWFAMLEGRGHLTLLDRPIRARTLTTAVRSALRARARQYELRALLAQLARAASERERLLEAEREARGNAEWASHAKDEFLATLSHELRTPLNAILGWTSMLLDGSLPATRSQEALATIDRNARAQTQLIQDMLDVSAIVSGKMRLTLSDADFGAIVRFALETIRPAAELKAVRIDGRIAQPARMRADPDRLLQIASNLLVNAVKFTPRGGRVHVRLEERGASMQLTVVDTGRGIAAEFLPHVFDHFRQADGSPTRKFGGLGLGLAIVRHLAELHGGAAEARSEGEGKGATFVVTLPIATRVEEGASGYHRLDDPPSDARLSRPPEP
jgi:signal transduction histidine kinase